MPAAGGAVRATPARRKAGGGKAAGSSSPTASDNRRLRQDDAKRQRASRGAYEAGQASRRGDEGAVERAAFTDPEEQSAWDAGWADAAPPSAAARARGLGSRAAASPAGQRAGGIATDGAGFVLGLIGWGFALAYLKYGPAGAKGWLAAKFLNRPYIPVGATVGSGVAGGAGAVVGGIARGAHP